MLVLDDAQVAVNRVVEHDLRFGPDSGEDQILHCAADTGAEPARGEDRCSADVVDLDEFVAVVDQDAVEEGVQLLYLRRVGPHGRVQQLGEERQQCLVAVGQSEPLVAEDPVVGPVEWVEDAVLGDVEAGRGVPGVGARQLLEVLEPGEEVRLLGRPGPDRLHLGKSLDEAAAGDVGDLPGSGNHGPRR